MLCDPPLIERLLREVKERPIVLVATSGGPEGDGLCARPLRELVEAIPTWTWIANEGLHFSRGTLAIVRKAVLDATTAPRREGVLLLELGRGAIRLRWYDQARRQLGPEVFGYVEN